MLAIGASIDSTQVAKSHVLDTAQNQPALMCHGQQIIAIYCMGMK
jgi:hypothetical protein